MITIAAGATDQSIDVFIQDSSSTVGEGLTGLVYNSGSLTCYYRRGHTGTPTALTLATLAAITTAHADGGFKEADATNCKGLYRLDLSDAIVAAGVDFVTIYLRGATNMVPSVTRIKLEAPVALADITDPILTDARAEPSAVPAANASMAEKIDWMFARCLHPTDENSSTNKQRLYNSAGDTVIAEADVTTSGTTTTVGKMAAP